MSAQIGAGKGHKVYYTVSVELYNYSCVKMDADVWAEELLKQRAHSE